MAEKVGKGLAKGWRGVGEGLAKGWRRAGKGLADFLAPSNFRIPRGVRLETLVCDSMAMVCNRVAFTKTMGITTTMQTTKTTETATNKRVECWISGNHRNHGNDENHGNPGTPVKQQVPQTAGLAQPNFGPSNVPKNLFSQASQIFL